MSADIEALARLNAEGMQAILHGQIETPEQAVRALGAVGGFIAGLSQDLALSVQANQELHAEIETMTGLLTALLPLAEQGTGSWAQDAHQVEAARAYLEARGAL